LICLDPDAKASYESDGAIRAAVEAGIAAANAKLSRVEQIKKFTILDDTWEPGSEFLTPTNKLKRKPIADHYALVIEQLYAQDGH
jgi:long-subunit acyl-CoA synthetase (AMP-forming)